MGCTPSRADVLPLPGTLALTRSGESWAQSERDGSASEQRGETSDGTTSSGQHGAGLATGDSWVSGDARAGCRVPPERDVSRVYVEERLREKRVVNCASLATSEEIAGQPAFAESLIAKVKASSRADDSEPRCPATPGHGDEPWEDGDPELADGCAEERSKVDFPDAMVQAHKATYEYLNRTLRDYDDIMKSADQIAETQKSLQQMISFLFFKCEEINGTTRSAVLAGEALLKSLKFGLSGRCYDKAEGLELPQQVLCYSVNKLLAISDSTNSVTSGALDLIVSYISSAHEKLRDKLSTKMQLDASASALMVQLALHAAGADTPSGTDDGATALSEDSGIAADSESLSEWSADSLGVKLTAAQAIDGHAESGPSCDGCAPAWEAAREPEAVVRPPGSRSMSHRCALEKQFKDVFYPPHVSMFAEPGDSESVEEGCAVAAAAAAATDRPAAERCRASFLRSLDALADDVVDEAHVNVGVLDDETEDGRCESERQIEFAKRHVMQIVGNSSEMDELVLKLKEAVSSRILFMSSGPLDPEWSEEEGKTQSGNRPRSAQASPSKGTSRRRSRSADSIGNQQEDVTLRELHRVQRNISKCLEATFQTAKRSVLIDKQRRPKISSAAQGSQSRSGSRIKTSLDKGFSVLPNHGVLKGNKSEQPKSSKLCCVKKSGPFKSIVPHAQPSPPKESNQPQAPLSKTVPVIGQKSNSSRNASMPNYSGASCAPFKPKLFNAVGVLPPLPTRYRLLKPAVCPDSFVKIDDELPPSSQDPTHKEQGESSHPSLAERQDGLSQARLPSPPSHRKSQSPPAKWRNRHVVYPDGQSSPPQPRQASPPPHFTQPSPPIEHKDSGLKSETRRESLIQHATQTIPPKIRQPSSPPTRFPSPPRTTQASPPSSRQPSPPRTSFPSPSRTTQATSLGSRQPSPPRARYQSPPRSTQINPPGTRQPSPSTQHGGASPPSHWRRVKSTCPDKESSPPLTKQASPPIVRQPSPPSQRNNSSPVRQWRHVHLPNTDEQMSPPLPSSRHFQPLLNDGQISSPQNGACPSTPPWATEPSQRLERRQAFRRLPSPPMQPGDATPCPLPMPPGGQRKLPSPPAGQPKLGSPPPRGRQLSPGRLRQLSPAIQEKMGTFSMSEPSATAPRSSADEATREVAQAWQSPNTNAGSIFCSAPSSMFKATNVTDDQGLYKSAGSQHRTDQLQLAHAPCRVHAGAGGAAARASRESEDDASGVPGKHDCTDDGGRADSGPECSCVAQGHGDPRKLDGGPDFLVQGRGLCSPGPAEEN